MYAVFIRTTLNWKMYLFPKYYNLLFIYPYDYEYFIVIIEAMHNIDISIRHQYRTNIPILVLWDLIIFLYFLRIFCLFYNSKENKNNDLIK